MFPFVCPIAVASLFSNPGDLPVPVPNPCGLFRHTLVREIGCGGWLRGQTFRLTTCDDGVWHERAWGRDGGRRTLTPGWAGDLARVRWVGGSVVGARADIYLGDRWVLKLSAERSDAGIGFKVCLVYFPYEGVEVGVGWEPLRPRLFVRLGFGFDDWFDFVCMWLFLRH